MYERTFKEGIKAQQEAEKIDVVAAAEADTIEFEAVQPETRLQRLGNLVLRGLQALGKPYVGGYGSARMGVPPNLPPRPPETKTESDEETTEGGW